MQFARRQAVTAALFSFVCATSIAAAPPNNSAGLRFLSPDDARNALTTDCDFFENLTLFDLEVRLQKKLAPEDRTHALQELTDLIRQSVMPWQAKETSALQGPIASILQQVRDLYPKISLPTIDLIKTNGREEGGASYTRGSAIVIPQFMLGPNAAELLRHELFHVISRHDPAVREKLYQAIGFSKVKGFVPPASVNRITNPDGVDYSWSIKLKSEGQPIEALLFVYSPKEYGGGGLFNYVKFGFLELEHTDGGCMAKLDGSGRPLVHQPQQLQGLYEQVGRNTEYLIHPDEILADNFKLVLAYRDPKRRSAIAARYDTKLLDKIDAVLKEVHTEQ